MSSFLSRRITEQAKKEVEERASADASFRGFADEAEPETAVAAPVDARPADQPDEPVHNGSSVPKRRTSTKVAQLRKQFRSKLLASID